MQLLESKASRILVMKWRSSGARGVAPVRASHSQVQISTAPVQANPSILDWQALSYAACAAQHTSLCYYGWDNLEAILNSKNLRLVDRGTTYYTRWYVADGCIDDVQFAKTALQGGGARGGQNGRSTGAGINAGAVARFLGRLNVIPPTPQRFIHLRGVAWSSTDTDSRRVWRHLGMVWPRPYVPEVTHPPGILVAHDGVASFAEELYERLEPLITSSPHPITFVGHSLGGALAKLLMVQARLKANRAPQSLSCMTFGSPPVLAHRDGGGGSRVLQLLQMDKTQCRNFVHEDDPVPRAMLTVDPTYRTLMALGPVKNLLELRQRLLGQGSLLSMDRFLFENVGEVVLLRSGSEGGLSVSLLDEIDEARLELSLRKILNAPMQAMKLWLDHHWVSYSQELEVAALLAVRSAAQEAQVGL